MSEPQDRAQYDEDQEDKPVKLGYEGSEVTVIMRYAYLAFLIFSVYYVISNGVPSLKEWLTDPPIDLF